jgi:hypothetical protein
MTSLLYKQSVVMADCFLFSNLKFGGILIIDNMTT